MILSLLFALAQQPTDLVVIVLDDVAAADLALYGGPVVCPNIEALAAQGVSFTRCYANPTCSPSRRALLTGHWWVRTSGDDCSTRTSNSPSAAEVFLPECLPHTSGLVGKWHLSGDPYGGPWERAPIAQGFDYWSAGIESNLNVCGSINYKNWIKATASAMGSISGQSTTYEAAVARDIFIGGWTVAPSPKLSVFCSNLAHAPFSPPPASMLPPGYVVGTTPRAWYEAMIVAYDTLIGRMLQSIDLAHTLVIVTADNGTPPTVAPDARAKGTTYERGVRVPLVMAGLPVDAPGRTESELVHLVDVWATCIEAGSGAILGGSPYPIVSVSLMPSLQNVGHLPYHDAVLSGCFWGDVGGDVCSVSQAGIKLRWVDADGDRVPDIQELYDLGQDPTEQANLLSDPAYAASLASAQAFLQASIP